MGYFGVVLGLLWGHFGVIMSMWGWFSATLVASEGSWRKFWVSWAGLGGLWAGFGGPEAEYTHICE